MSQTLAMMLRQVRGKELEIFMATVSTKSMAKTARHLHMSQPTVTKAIRYLERLFDVKLFVRVSNGVVLTPAGRVLARHVAKFRANFADLVEDIQLAHSAA
jgi:DNA-binding transcriptional LysR family regulator